MHHHCMHARDALSTNLKACAKDLGFALVGIAPAVTPTGFHHLVKWIEHGHAASMDWVDRRREAYRHPDGVMPGTRSVIMAAMNYHDGTIPAAGPRIARYALGSADYHDVLKSRLQQLSEHLKSEITSARTRVVVDTAPLLERDFGRLAGIGWFGKNTMLISRSIGSYFFLGALLTDAELRYDVPEDHNFCGTCTRCLDACPTDAFPEPGVLDARRCISYLTIELRGASIPMEFRTGIGNWLFGCDICQDVCPWNRFAPSQTLSELRSSSDQCLVDVRSILRLTDAEFESQFAGSPLLRPGRVGLLSNATVVAANLAMTGALPELQILVADANPVLREVAQWAIDRLRGQVA